DSTQNFFDKKGRCLFCDILAQERAAGIRIVLESDEFVAVAPFASRFPCETWILPTKHRSQFAFSSAGEFNELGKVLRCVLRALNSGLDDPPHNIIIHSDQLASGELPNYHWRMEILPRLTGIAGFECGTGIHINPVPPEQAAAYLRSYL